MHLLLGVYLLVAFVIVPLLTPLRQLSVFSPALILVGLLPPLVLLTMIALGTRVISIHNHMTLVLYMTLVQAALVGLGNAFEGEIRVFFSHLFQIFSAIVMLAAGLRWGGGFSVIFWRRFAMMVLMATSLSTAMSLRIWDAGDLNRFYTPAYSLIFVVACSLALRPGGKRLTFGSLVVAIISNKRGPLISVVLMLLTYHGAQLLLLRQYLPKFSRLGVTRFLPILLALTSAVFVVPSVGSFDDHIILRAFTETTSRLLKIVNADSQSFDLSAYSAGRIEEIELGIEALGGVAPLIGNGAGWSVLKSSGQSVQNLHFTPLSLVVVFGLPFALFFYLYSLSLICSNIRACLKNGSTTERIAIFYLIGSLLHTMVAFSIFVDLLNFFFIGVLINAKASRLGSNPSVSRRI